MKPLGLTFSRFCLSLFLIASMHLPHHGFAQSDSSDIQAHDAKFLEFVETLRALNDPKINAMIPALIAEHNLKLDQATGRNRSADATTKDRQQLLSYKSANENSSATQVIQVQGKRNDAVGFTCVIERDEKSKIFTASKCKTVGTSEPRKLALNNMLFLALSVQGSSPEQLILELKAQILASIQKKNLNPSSAKEALVVVENPEMDTDSSGVMTGEIQNFVGHQLPITETDQGPLSVFYNMNAYFQTKDSVLRDALQLMQQQPDLNKEYGTNSELLTKHRDINGWVLQFGAGWASKNFFDLLKKYYDQNGPGQKVIYRTTSTTSRWTQSTFPDQWSHKIQTSNKTYQIDYYGIPGSYLYVYRMMPEGANPNDPTYYSMITRSQVGAGQIVADVWLSSWSYHSSRDKFVTNKIGAMPHFTFDVRQVVNSMNDPSIKVMDDRNSGLVQLIIVARKLY